MLFIAQTIAQTRVDNRKEGKNLRPVNILTRRKKEGGNYFPVTILALATKEEIKIVQPPASAPIIAEDECKRHAYVRLSTLFSRSGAQGNLFRARR